MVTSNSNNEKPKIKSVSENERKTEKSNGRRGFGVEETKTSWIIFLLGVQQLGNLRY